MNKLIVLFVALLLPLSGFAKTVYIGDSIAEGYKLAVKADGITKVGASPQEVEEMLKQNPVGDTVVLSTGASNDCKNVAGVQRNITLAHFLYNKVYVLGAPYCGSMVEMEMRQRCTNGCEFVPVTPGKDGIHPQYYKKLPY